MTWDLDIDEEDSRTAIHRRHGGSEGRGISAPARATGRNNILLWWQPGRGELFGYSDGWSEDGRTFYFSGTGQLGDQRFEAPNAENGRVRDHVENGDQIRLLRYVGKNLVRYIGELCIDSDAPWRWVDGPDRRQQMRRMIEFRFRPVGTIDVPGTDRIREDLADTSAQETLPDPPPEPAATDIEALRSESFARLTKTRVALARRAESRLVQDFAGWLETEHGLSATGLRIPNAGEGRNLRADLYVHEPRILIEAKATTARESIRMAIGQLHDYRRWIVPPPRMCVLTPAQPSEDMAELLESLDIAIAWRNASGFVIRPSSVFMPT